MRVVYATSLPWTGPVAHLHDLVPHVVALGIDVHVLCQEDEVARAFGDAEIPASVAPLRHKLDLAGTARLLPHFAGADIVHTHDRRTGLLARSTGVLRGARVVHTFHGLPDEIADKVGRPDAAVPPEVGRLKLAWLLHGYLRLEGLLARTGAVVVPSRALADFLVAHGLPARRVHVIPSCIEVRRFRPGPAQDPLAVGATAMLIHRKGIDILIDACARVGVPSRLEIFGDGPLRAELEERGARAGIDVVFHGHVGDLRSRLEQLDVFVLSSRGENLPIAVLEAMATALPIVATRVGGVPELLDDGDTGLLVPAEDPGAIAAAIRRLADDPELRERLGQRAAQVAGERFSAPRIARHLVDVYEGLLGRRPTVAS